MTNIKLYLIALNLILISAFSNIKGQDTLNLKQLNSNLPLQNVQLLTDTIGNNLPQFNFQNRPIANKFWRAMGYSLIYNVSMGIYLISLPDEITQWHAADKFQIPVMLNQYKKSFTTPPVIDHDLWFVNYLGHPYQGSYYHNTMRSQGCTFVQSSLYNVFQSVIWEYVWEGGLEQPSIQDMLVTPIVGSMLGELTHRAALSMRQNGFKWYEKVAVCIINPAYAINNGFKVKKKASQYK